MNSSKKITFDVKSQRLLYQLNNLYSWVDCHLKVENDNRENLFNKWKSGYIDRRIGNQLYLIYDHLFGEGIKFDYRAEIKTELWKLAKQKFNKDETRMFPYWTDELKTQKLHEYYKSILAAKFLLDIFEENGQKMSLVTETGIKIKMLDFGI